MVFLYKPLLKKEYASVIQEAYKDNRRYENKLYKALFLFNKKKYAEAISLLEVLVQQKNQTEAEMGTVYFFLALCNDCMGKKDTAISYYEKSIEKNPEIDRAYSNVGLLYNSIGEREKAKDSFEKAILINPENPYPYNNMAHLLIDLKEYDEAIYYGAKAYELRDWLYQAAYALAIAYAKTGDKEKAELFYNRCKELGNCDLDKLRAKMEA